MHSEPAILKRVCAPATRLADDHRTVVGMEEPGLTELLDRLRDAVVRNLDREGGLVLDAGRWGDRQLLTGTRPPEAKPPTERIENLPAAEAAAKIADWLAARKLI